MVSAALQSVPLSGFLLGIVSAKRHEMSMGTYRVSEMISKLHRKALASTALAFEDVGIVPESGGQNDTKTTWSVLSCSQRHSLDSSEQSFQLIDMTAMGTYLVSKVISKLLRKALT